MVTIMILELLLISIHALREEGDTETVDDQLARVLAFQSTPSARRATVSAVEKQKRSVKFQSTPSARRATGSSRRARNEQRISIHALREEGDHTSKGSVPGITDFNPRPPRGGRPIRLHLRSLPSSDFNPRPPRGGRRTAAKASLSSGLFQSTPSARRATVDAVAETAVGVNFNPRPPRGGRLEWLPTVIKAVDFNPRPPRGGRHAKIYNKTANKTFQSTPSARRATSAATRRCM